MIEERMMHKVVCDGCGRATYHEAASFDDEPPLGFHGDVTETTLDGGYSNMWFAHSKRCVGKAVLNSLARARAATNTEGRP